MDRLLLVRVCVCVCVCDLLGREDSSKAAFECKTTAVPTTAQEGMMPAKEPARENISLSEQSRFCCLKSFGQGRDCRNFRLR